MTAERPELFVLVFHRALGLVVEVCLVNVVVFRANEELVGLVFRELHGLDPGINLIVVFSLRVVVEQVKRYLGAAQLSKVPEAQL